MLWVEGRVLNNCEGQEEKRKSSEKEGQESSDFANVGSVYRNVSYHFIHSPLQFELNGSNAPS